MSDDEEPDYMSEDFLTACAQNDLRPGLIHNRSKQREHAVSKRKQEIDSEQRKKHASSKTMAQDRLQEGLDQPLGPENKGFSMLQKMGFKPGTSLGSNQSGLLEPISISVKSDRKGFGREQALRELHERKRAIREKAKKPLSVEDFRAELSKKHKEGEIKMGLLQSQKVCLNLDRESMIDEPEEAWFWPPWVHKQDEDEENEEEEEELVEDFSPSEKLEMLTMYLRGTYLYCNWCGIQYENEDEMNSSCPGSTKDEH